MNRLMPLLIVLVMVVAGLAAGPAAFGRIALGLGLPAFAVPLLADPGWKGVALFQAGRYAEADDAFRAAGRTATFNRGNSLAATGRYAESVAYYDAVLFSDPADQDARANRELVSRLVDPVIGEANDIQGIATIATPEDVPEGAEGRPAPVTPLTEQRSVLPRFAAQSIVASEQWLQTLADEPGRYLKLRLLAEQERRYRMGLAAPGGGDEW